jgi:hypothetical protein
MKEDIVATVRRSLPAEAQHQVFRGVFDDWQTKAGVLSALPDAPVVPDDSRQGRTVWTWIQSRFGRTTENRRAAAAGSERAGRRVAVL